MNTQWQRLSHDEFRRPQHDAANQTTFYISPFEIPEAFRSEHDARTGNLAIEFRYLDSDEPSRDLKLEGGVIVRIGKNSARLFGMIIPEEVFKRAIEVHLTRAQAAAQAINRIPSRLGTHRDNYTVTSGLFEQNRINPLVAG